MLKIIQSSLEFPKPAHAIINIDFFNKQLLYYNLTIIIIVDGLNEIVLFKMIHLLNNTFLSSHSLKLT